MGSTVPAHGAAGIVCIEIAALLTSAALPYTLFCIVPLLYYSSFVPENTLVQKLYCN